MTRKRRFTFQPSAAALANDPSLEFVFRQGKADAYNPRRKTQSHKSVAVQLEAIYAVSAKERQIRKPESVRLNLDEQNKGRADTQAAHDMNVSPRHGSVCEARE